MDEKRYLGRIGVEIDRGPKTEFDRLVELQRRHLYTVPFTNWFVLENDGTTMQSSTVVPRIVSGGGGLCYDLNGSFAWLLERLGFDVTFVSARPVRDDGSYGPAYDHLALLVDDHVVDVGFGAFARQPLPLGGTQRTDVSGTYRVFFDDDGYVVQKRAERDWEESYRFDTQPRTAGEFEEMTVHHSTSPESPFTDELLVSIATENGRKTLSGTTLTVTNGDTRERRDVQPGTVTDVLTDEFGLETRTM
ncbi:acetyltransferase [Natrarchaeobius halalkaliphilus]|uniref:Acetyltransferase n=1 Tax=Natrarchaeobius halalkaliphilus TaxID=1679091 RepID=A0A3N6P606_9EURY|nr:arylamine N-acetyltransferase [Natrarchaeobius halalkaliphilus]RQG91135.1 acetyltransferase [Natrarchaeobius halalkaliphilus]